MVAPTGGVTSRPILDDHPPTGTERRFLNRELSWLSFNERVLDLARAPDMPVLERAKFLAIFSANLDEFFQVRVAAIKEQQAAELPGSAADEMTPAEQLAAISAHAHELMMEQARIFRELVQPGLNDAGLVLSGMDELDDDDLKYLDTEFDERVFPVLTPLAVDPAHPFPYISNLSLNLAVIVRDPSENERRFARVKIPPILPRFVVMPDNERYVPLEQVIANRLDRLFPGLEIIETHPFRVTRNADLSVEEEEADDLLAAIESELTRRRFGRCVRLEIEPGMTPEVLALLIRELEVHPDDVLRIPGPLDLSGLWSLYALDRPDLKLEPFAPTTQPRLAGGAVEETDIFTVIRNGDVLVHHPYDSFASSVQRFIEEAATDPDVLAIKQTLYRTSGKGSPIVTALIRAAESGKQVAVLVELKARFDEQANIEWARQLETAGVHVTYGVVGYKTHTKVALVVRREGDQVVRYAHIGTGNYNEGTARIYEDIGLLTADAEIGADLSDLFNVLTGYGRRSEFRKLLVAPTTLKPRMLELIQREAAHGEDGRIIAKMNSLVDAEVIEALYDASAAGTPIDLIVRGICCLRPGLAGLSENIRVRSVVGRYLEHSRIFRFGNEDRGVDIFIGSADWMPRNLIRRYEAVVPIEQPELKEQLDGVLEVLLADNTLSWELRPDGSWIRNQPTIGAPIVVAHAALQEAARGRAAWR
ncbi:MAG: RNA degradosome polyphosphate kinase [Nitriliruptorales bacterium]|nr:RNA degradosome polyphosphate kinase [Nitriliruptorales bacterium]